MLTMLLGWAMALVFGAGGYLLSSLIGFCGAMAVMCLLSGGACFGLVRYLFTRGVGKVESLPA